MHTPCDVAILVLSVACFGGAVNVAVLLRPEPGEPNGVRGLRWFFWTLAASFLWLMVLDVAWVGFGFPLTTMFWRMIGFRVLVFIGLIGLMWKLWRPGKGHAVHHAADRP